MKENTLKFKKGGLDTIVAYIVVMLPLLYVLIYMVATIYHFSVQMYMNQVVKEATVMASTYGAITQGHEEYIKTKLGDILGRDDNGTKCDIKYYKRTFDEETGTVGPLVSCEGVRPEVKKADIIGIQVISKEPSILGTVTAFNIFQSTSNEDIDVKYTSYREEIRRNEREVTAK